MMKKELMSDENEEKGEIDSSIIQDNTEEVEIEGKNGINIVDIFS